MVQGRSFGRKLFLGINFAVLCFLSFIIFNMSFGFKLPAPALVYALYLTQWKSCCCGRTGFTVARGLHSQLL